MRHAVAEFRGSYTVMVTPFTERDQAVDEGRVRQFVDWQIAEGTHGLIPLGSTGEFLSLTREERRNVAATVIAQAGGRVPVLIGTAAEWTDEAIAMSKEAEALGADGVMIVPPYYSSPTEDEIFAHYRRIAEAITIPIMIYNNPFTSNVDLKPHLVARLSRIDNISCIKESSGDVTRINQIGDLCGDRMTVFAGYHPWESYRAGAAGYVSVFGNIAPALSRDLFVASTGNTDLEQSRAIYNRVRPLLDAISGDLYVSATKAALGLVGMPVGEPRPPRLPLPPAKLEPLRAVLAALGLIEKRAA